VNLPNQLTLARLALTVVFVGALATQYPYNHTVALVVFLVATLTDYLDGFLARRWQLITDFGKLMDPLVDKILTAAAFILLIPLDAFPAWVVITIVAREFLITGLRTLANQKGIVLPAERLGKHKTAWQMLTIIYFLLLLAWTDWTSTSPAWMDFAWNTIGGLLTAITVFLTVYSGLAYFWKNRQLISTR
jgi:CDP-diacylglycerol---glycerol-3-phosphate 3-phosphatidyltransferase